MAKFPLWMRDKNGKPFQQLGFKLSSSEPFAMGGQAKLYHAHTVSFLNYNGDESWVFKVFKKGTYLEDILRLFPPTMLADEKTRIQGHFVAGHNCNPIAGVRLFKSTGQFAFLMKRAWGDLRMLIEKRMENNEDLPFPTDVAIRIMHEIAKGMLSLHAKDIVHRDLKASNVLIFGSGFKNDFDPVLLKPDGFRCLIADFECSVGIIGTKFWRAPELLRAVKNRTINQQPEIFTKQVDVYGFGVTCSETLSGRIPLDHVGAIDYDKVINGERPELPRSTTPWVKDLVISCWHDEPSRRPTFSKIVERFRNGK